MRTFWQRWLKWSVEAGIDYFIGRKIPAWLDSLGLEDVGGESHTAQFNGGSDWAAYWTETMRELAPSLLKSGYVTEKCSRSSTPAIRTRIIGPASSPSQRIGDASRHEPRIYVGLEWHLTLPCCCRGAAVH